MDYNRMARKLREKIGVFSGVLSNGTPKVAGRFVQEMIYGIQASQSVVQKWTPEIGQSYKV